MNPYTGELINLRLGEKAPEGFEPVPRGAESREAALKLRLAAMAGLVASAFDPTPQVKAQIHLRGHTPLAVWAKKKRKAKIAAASHRRNRK